MPTLRLALNEGRLRLWSGLVLVAYVVPHLLNHTLGLISLDAMEGLRQVISAVWYSLPGTIALYGAFLIHFSLGLLSLFRRPHLRMPLWEAAQLTLGLLVWPLLLAHALGTRGAATLLGIDVTYPLVVATLWLVREWGWLQQILLVFVVWGHLCVGLHFWLRLRSGYRRIVPLLYPLAVLLPLLAVAGFVRAGADVGALDAADPAWRTSLLAPRDNAPAAAKATLQQTADALMGAIFGAIALTLVCRLVRTAYRNRHGRYRLGCPDGRTLIAPVGQTVLATIRAAGIPHAAVCGGRGRCTTCRVRVTEGRAGLAPPEEVESRALSRLGTPENVRLACQLRPRGDLTVLPLLPPQAVASSSAAGGVNGREQTVVILFADLRGSTRLGERKLPYDVLFILNQFFAEMAAALRATDGHYAQFNGDGLMALYGLDGDIQRAARQAMAGADQMLNRLEQLNQVLAMELAEPLRMGIGIHCGEAIVGTMGPPAAPILSAIGDNVNVAARLESLTKHYDAPVVISVEAVKAAGIEAPGEGRHLSNVSGRHGPIEIFARAHPASWLAALRR